MEYLDDEFSWLEMRIRIVKLQLSEEENSFSLNKDTRKPETVIRELKAKERTLKGMKNLGKFFCIFIFFSFYCFEILVDFL